MNQSTFEGLEPRIVIFNQRRLIGLSLSMNLVDNRTSDLWRGFLPRRSEILNPVNTDMFSINVYDPAYFKEFNPENHFIKWAALEVTEECKIPDGMKSIILEGGKYAVFDYRGSSSDSRIFQFIYSRWLPNSNYQLDERPHFEILGKNYRNNDPNSEEEIWIPIIDKN